ncbi:MAG: hypothetical protein GF331_03845 [Chitinivibrionales bacterium]|nr:hypothetical protein [Chitinivibrionales bacterium]
MPDTPSAAPASADTTDAAQATELRLDEHKARQYIEKLRLEQNLPMGLVAGALASALGAVLWATVTALSGLQIGWMAVGIGFLVGFAVRTFGKGIDKVFGVTGAALSLLGCVVGNFVSILIIISREQTLPMGTLLANLSPAVCLELMAAAFHPLDLLFYAIAVYEGYRFSFRVIDQQELVAAAQA